MRLTLTTLLPCDVGLVRDAVMCPRLLDYVAHPLVRFTPIDPPELPEPWRPGAYLVAMRVFGVLPMGTQTIGLSFPPPSQPDGFVVHDAGYGTLIPVWDHRVTVMPAGPRATWYTDEVRIEAGLLTPLVWAWAQVFFRHRQQRWRRLVANGFDYAR